MRQRGIRTLIALVAGFIFLTAIGGGIAILSGVDEFPLEWLEGMPFNDYTVPALLLAVFVGGSALLGVTDVCIRSMVVARPL